MPLISDAMLDKLMKMADLNTPLLHINKKDPIDLIPVSTKSKTWHEMKRSKYTEHKEDLQQRHFLFRSAQVSSTTASIFNQIKDCNE